jgi:hypothetical protein
MHRQPDQAVALASLLVPRSARASSTSIQSFTLRICGCTGLHTAQPITVKPSSWRCI